MKWIRWAVIAGVVSLGQAALAAGCNDWNTGAFFENADGELVRECLAAGADPGARNEERGITPLHYAAGRDNAAAIAALLAAACRSQRAGQAWHNPAALGGLWRRGRGASGRRRRSQRAGQGGRTPLHSAASGHAAVAALLAGGADPKARAKYGWTPLHSAARERPRGGHRGASGRRRRSQRADDQVWRDPAALGGLWPRGGRGASGRRRRP